MILQLAAVGVGSADIAPKMSSNRKIQAFNMTGAHKARLRMSALDFWDRARNVADSAHPIRPGARTLVPSIINSKTRAAVSRSV